MNPATMETLQLFRGDTIIVRYDLALIYVGFHRLNASRRGKKRRDTGSTICHSKHYLCLNSCCSPYLLKFR